MPTLLCVLLANGTGGFAAIANAPPAATAAAARSPISTATASSTSPPPTSSSATVALFVGNGAGDLRRGATVGTNNATRALALGDFNRQRRPRSRHRGRQPEQSWRSASATAPAGFGGFVSSLAMGTTANALAAADLNHDGRLDVVASNGSIQTIHILGNGDGHLRPRRGDRARRLARGGRHRR